MTQSQVGVFSLSSSIPVLNICSTIGYTGYMDFLKSNQIIYPLLKGIDVASRPFVVMRLVVQYNEKIVYCAQTFFQRYTDKAYPWIGGVLSA